MKAFIDLPKLDALQDQVTKAKTCVCAHMQEKECVVQPKF